MKKAMIVVISILLSLYIIVILFFYLKQESIIFFPVKTKAELRYNFPNKFKEVYYNTANNGKIHSLRFFSENTKGIVLYLHGNAGNLEDWGNVYSQFTSRNYDVVIVDYRTYGKSTGKLTEENIHSDIQYIYDEIKKEFSEKEIVVFGRSLGSGIAVKLASSNKPKALILETPYYSILEIAQKTVPFIPVNLILKFKFESNKYITKVKSPILFLHGKKDQVIPFQSGIKLYNLVKENSSFITFEEGTHSNLSEFGDYNVALDSF